MVAPEQHRSNVRTWQIPHCGTACMQVVRHDSLSGRARQLFGQMQRCMDISAVLFLFKLSYLQVLSFESTLLARPLAAHGFARLLFQRRCHVIGPHRQLSAEPLKLGQIVLL